MIKLRKLNFKLLIKPIIAILLFSIVTVGHSDPVTENMSEDPEVVFSEVDADPNVLMILDLSGSMGRNFGGEQIGNWDDDIITAECDSTPDSPRDVFCAENQANLSVCAMQHCTNDGHRCGRVCMLYTSF